MSLHARCLLLCCIIAASCAQQQCFFYVYVSGIDGAESIVLDLGETKDPIDELNTLEKVRARGGYEVWFGSYTPTLLTCERQESRRDDRRYLEESIRAMCYYSKADFNALNENAVSNQGGACSAALCQNRVLGYCPAHCGFGFCCSGSYHEKPPGCSEFTYAYSPVIYGHDVADHTTDSLRCRSVRDTSTSRADGDQNVFPTACANTDGTMATHPVLATGNLQENVLSIFFSKQRKYCLEITFTLRLWSLEYNSAHAPTTTYIDRGYTVGLWAVNYELDLVIDSRYNCGYIKCTQSGTIVYRGTTVFSLTPGAVVTCKSNYQCVSQRLILVKAMYTADGVLYFSTSNAVTSISEPLGAFTPSYEGHICSSQTCVENSDGYATSSPSRCSARRCYTAPHRIYYRRFEPHYQASVAGGNLVNGMYFFDRHVGVLDIPDVDVDSYSASDILGTAYWCEPKLCTPGSPFGSDSAVARFDEDNQPKCRDNSLWSIRPVMQKDVPTDWNAHIKTSPSEHCGAAYLIVTEAECRSAAAKLGLTWSSVHSWGNHKPGCFAGGLMSDTTQTHNGYAHFNEHLEVPTGSAVNGYAICKEADTKLIPWPAPLSGQWSSQILPLPTQHCEARYLIATEAECRSAAEELGLTWSSVHSWGNHKPGCFAGGGITDAGHNGNAHFNTNLEVASSSAVNGFAICKQAVQLLTSIDEHCDAERLIVTEAECESAARELELTWSNAGTYGGIKGGCFAGRAIGTSVHNGAVHFNRDLAPVSTVDGFAICKGSRNLNYSDFLDIYKCRHYDTPFQTTQYTSWNASVCDRAALDSAYRYQTPDGVSVMPDPYSGLTVASHRDQLKTAPGVESPLAEFMSMGSTEAQAGAKWPVFRDTPAKVNCPHVEVFSDAGVSKARAVSCLRGGFTWVHGRPDDDEITRLLAYDAGRLHFDRACDVGDYVANRLHNEDEGVLYNAELGHCYKINGTEWLESWNRNTDTWNTDNHVYTFFRAKRDCDYTVSDLEMVTTIDDATGMECVGSGWHSGDIEQCARICYEDPSFNGKITFTGNGCKCCHNANYWSSSAAYNGWQVLEVYQKRLVNNDAKTITCEYAYTCPDSVLLFRRAIPWADEGQPEPNSASNLKTLAEDCIATYAQTAGVQEGTDAWSDWLDVGRLSASAEADPEKCAGISAVAQQVEIKDNPTATDQCYRQYCLANPDLNRGYCNATATESECIAGCKYHWINYGKFEVNNGRTNQGNPWVCMHLTGLPLHYDWFHAAQSGWNGVKQPTEVHNARMWGGNHFETMEVVAVPRIVCGNYIESAFATDPVYCADCPDNAKPASNGRVLFALDDTANYPAATLAPTIAPTVPPTPAGTGQQCGQYHYMVAGEHVKSGQVAEGRIIAEPTSLHSIDLAEKMGSGLPDEFDKWVGQFLRGETQLITSSASRRSSGRSLLSSSSPLCEGTDAINVDFVAGYGPTHGIVHHRTESNQAIGGEVIVADQHQGQTNQPAPTPAPTPAPRSSDGHYVVISGGFLCPIMKYTNTETCSATTEMSNVQFEDHIETKTVLGVDPALKDCSRIEPAYSQEAFYSTFATLQTVGGIQCFNLRTFVKCHHYGCTAPTVFKIGLLTVITVIASQNTAYTVANLLANPETIHMKTQSTIGGTDYIWQMRSRCPAVECQGTNDVVCASDPSLGADGTGSFYNDMTQRCYQPALAGGEVTVQCFHQDLCHRVWYMRPASTIAELEAVQRTELNAIARWNYCVDRYRFGFYSTHTYSVGNPQSLAHLTRYEAVKHWFNVDRGLASRKLFDPEACSGWYAVLEQTSDTGSCAGSCAGDCAQTCSPKVSSTNPGGEWPGVIPGGVFGIDGITCPMIGCGYYPGNDNTEPQHSYVQSQTLGGHEEITSGSDYAEGVVFCGKEDDLNTPPPTLAPTISQPAVTTPVVWTEDQPEFIAQALHSAPHSSTEYRCPAVRCFNGAVECVDPSPSNSFCGNAKFAHLPNSSLDVAGLTTGIVFCPPSVPITCDSVTFVVPGHGSGVIPLAGLSLEQNPPTSVNNSGTSAQVYGPNSDIHCPAVSCNTNWECASPFIGGLFLTTPVNPLFADQPAHVVIPDCQTVTCALSCRRSYKAVINQRPYSRLDGYMNLTYAVDSGKLMRDVGTDHLSGFSLTHNYSAYSNKPNDTHEEYFACPEVSCDRFTQHPGGGNGSDITGAVTTHCHGDPECEHWQADNHSVYCFQVAKPTPAPTPGRHTPDGYTVIGMPNYRNQNWQDVNIPSTIDCSISPYLNTDGPCIVNQSFCHPTQPLGMHNMLPFTDCHEPNEVCTANFSEWVMVGTSASSATRVVAEQPGFSLATATLANFTDFLSSHSSGETNWTSRSTGVWSMCTPWQVHAASNSTIPAFSEACHAFTCAIAQASGAQFSVTLDELGLCCTPSTVATNSSGRGLVYSDPVDHSPGWTGCLPGRACVFTGGESNACTCQDIQRELAAHAFSDPGPFTDCDTGPMHEELCAEASSSIWQSLGHNPDALRQCRTDGSFKYSTSQSGLLAPTSTAPTSTAPTSAAPTSAAPTLTAPTSTAPTLTAPTSTAPTSTAPTSTAPTSTAPTSVTTANTIYVGAGHLYPADGQSFYDITQTNLIQGQTYTFTRQGGQGSHPFQLRDINGDNIGSALTADGNSVTVTVGSYLGYYCTSHSNMQGSFDISTSRRALFVQHSATTNQCVEQILGSAVDFDSRHYMGCSLMAASSHAVSVFHAAPAVMYGASPLRVCPGPYPPYYPSLPKYYTLANFETQTSSLFAPCPETTGTQAGGASAAYYVEIATETQCRHASKLIGSAFEVTTANCSQEIDFALSREAMSLQHCAETCRNRMDCNCFGVVNHVCRMFGNPASGDFEGFAMTKLETPFRLSTMGEWQKLPAGCSWVQTNVDGYPEWQVVFNALLNYASWNAPQSTNRNMASGSMNCQFPENSMSLATVNNADTLNDASCQQSIEDLYPYRIGKDCSRLLDDILPPELQPGAMGNIDEYMAGYVSMLGNASGSVFLEIRLNHNRKSFQQPVRVTSVSIQQIPNVAGRRPRGNIQVQTQSPSIGTAVHWMNVGSLGELYRDTSYSGNVYPYFARIDLDYPVTTSAVRLLLLEPSAEYNIARVEIGGCAVDDVQRICASSTVPEPQWLDSTTWGQTSSFVRTASAIVFGTTPQYELVNSSGIHCSSGYVTITTEVQCEAARDALQQSGFHPGDLSLTQPRENSPFDGFVVARDGAVPGCHLDEFDIADSWQWESPSSTAEFKIQNSTNRVLFNTILSRYDSDNEENRARQLLLKQGHSWARGKAICVEASAAVREWQPVAGVLSTAALPSSGAIIDRLYTSNAVDRCELECRENTYCFVFQVEETNGQFRCQGFDSIASPSLPTSPGVFTPSYVRVSQPGKECPGPWYVPIQTISQCYEAFEHMPHVQRANSGSQTHRNSWLSPNEFLRSYNASEFYPGCMQLPPNMDEGNTPVWHSEYGFESFDRVFTFNAANRATDSNQPLTVGLERLLGYKAGALGYGMCVYHSHLAPATTDELVGMQEVIDLSTETMASLDANSLLDPVDEISTNLVEIPVVFNIQEVTIDHKWLATRSLELVLAGLDYSTTMAITRRAAEADATLHVVIRVAKSIQEETMERLQAYSADATSVNTVILHEQDSGSAAAAVASLSIGATSVVGGNLLLFPDVPVDLEQGHASHFWWNAECTCHGEECDHTKDTLQQFEFRVAAPLQGSAMQLGSLAVHPLDLESCNALCADTVACIATAFNEGPTPGPRCFHATDFALLAGLTHDDLGDIRVRVKLNKCPVVRVSSIELCDATDPSVCVEGADTPLHPRMPTNHSCWSHRGSATDVLCKDGNYVAMQQDTLECMQRGSIRSMCPLGTHMCAFPDEDFRDRECVYNASKCPLRPCGSHDFPVSELSNVLFATADGEVANGGNAPVVHTAPLESGNAAVTRAINSVARCGGDLGFTPGDKVMPHLNSSQCAAGFACCSESGTGCVCPQVVSAASSVMLDGRFADSCKPTVSIWPRCIAECATSGGECTHYIYDQESNDCLVCTSGDSFAPPPPGEKWVYRNVDATPVAHFAGMKPDLPSTVGLFVAQGFQRGAHRAEVKDMSRVPNGDWYAHLRKTETNVSVTVTGAERVVKHGWFSPSMCRSSCEENTEGKLCVFWQTFEEGYRNLVVAEEYCPPYTGCSLAVHVENGTCDCRHPFLRSSPFGACWHWLVSPETLLRDPSVGGLTAEWARSNGMVSGSVLWQKALSNDTFSRVDTCPTSYRPVNSFALRSERIAHCNRSAAALVTGDRAAVVNLTRRSDLLLGSPVPQCGCGCVQTVAQGELTVWYSEHDADMTVECARACGTPVCVMDESSFTTMEDSWMHCSERCTLLTGCTDWSWNMESLLCAVFDNATQHMSANNGRALPGFRSFFGTGWVSGLVAHDVDDIGENTIHVSRSQIFVSNLSTNVFESKMDTMRWFARHAVTGGTTVALPVQNITPGVYFGVVAGNSDEDLHRFMLQEVQSATPQTWSLAMFDGEYRSSERSLEVDTSCWHASAQGAVGQALGQELRCGGTEPHEGTECGPLGSLFARNTQLHNWQNYAKGWVFTAWVYAEDAKLDLLGGGQATQESLTTSEIDTVSTKVPSISRNALSHRLRVFFESPTEHGTYRHVVLPLTLSNNRWTYLVIAVAEGQPYLAISKNKGMVEVVSITSSHSEPLVSTPMQGLVFEAALRINTEKKDVASVAMHVALSRPELSPCYGRFLVPMDADPGHAVYVNPEYDVTESMVAQVAEDIGEPSEPLVFAAIVKRGRDQHTTFEWTRSDCLYQPVVKGARYYMEAVYQTKLRSPLGILDDVVDGTFLPRRLQVCDVLDSANKVLCLSQGESTEVLSAELWEAVNDQGDGSWLLRSVNTNTTAYFKLEPDYSTTYPQIYRAHVSNAQGFRVDAGLNDVHIHSARTNTSLGDPFSLAVHGVSPWLLSPLTTAPFTIVRRFSEDAIGVMYDSANPTGTIEITSAMASNLTETHRAVPQGCQEGSTKLVSLFTGRCVSHKGDAFVYADCGAPENLGSEEQCWVVQHAEQPHETSRGMATAASSDSWHTLAFDDNELWWHPEIMTIPLSDNRVFLHEDSVSDIEFQLEIDTVPGQLPAHNRAMPVRIYGFGQYPLASPRCAGTIQHMLLNCGTDCALSSSTPAGSDGTCQAQGAQAEAVECVPSLCRIQLASWHTGPYPHSPFVDFELVASSVGYLLKRRAWTVEEMQSSRQCLSVYQDPLYDDDLTIRSVECTASDTYLVQRPDSSPDQADRMVLSLLHPGKCLGISRADNRTLKLVDCSDTEFLAMVRHLLRDDASLQGRSSQSLYGAEDREAVFRYTDQVAHITGLYYRGIGRGQLRVIVSLAEDLDSLTATTDVELNKSAVVSLVDDTGEISYSPSVHVYKVRVQRETVRSATGQLHETRKFFLIKNGTIVDTRQQHECPVIQKADLLAFRESIDPAIATRLHGFVRGVQLHTYKAVEGATVSLDDTSARFGSGLLWRLTQQGSTFNLPSSDPDPCAEACRGSPNCTAARWAALTKTCELLSACDEILNVAEGNPNSLNLRTSAWALFDTRNDIQGGTKHRILPWHLENDENSWTGLLAADSTRKGDKVSARTAATQFREVANAHLYPDTAALIQGHKVTEPGFPDVIASSTNEGEELQCPNAHTFAFVGVFQSTQARFGYRYVFTPASEGGRGGLRLALSPDGHLKDKLSNVSVKVEGEAGCVSIVVVDCNHKFVVSVNGKVVHRLPECPFTVKNADTVARSWIGRSEVVCMGGEGRLTPNRHARLVAHFQAKHGMGSDLTGPNMCWQPSALNTQGKFYALPENRANYAPIDPKRWTWRVDSWAPSTATTTSETTLRCLDPAVCQPSVSASVAMYKQATVPHRASPFLISQGTVDEQGQPAMAFFNGSTFTDVDSAIAFKAPVTAAQERAECGIVEMHGQNKSLAPCSCEDSKFTPWQEDVERSEQCGQCETIQQVATFPQWVEGVQFTIRTGARNPDIVAVLKRYTRQLLDDRDAPCPEFHTDPAKFLVKADQIEQCPVCRQDCVLDSTGLIVASQRLQDLHAAAPCPTSRANGVACGNRTMRRSCLFHVPILQPATNGGRSCLQVAREAVQSITNANSMQRVGTSGGVAYYSDEVGDSVSLDILSEGYYATEAVINIMVKQSAVHPAQQWAWITPQMQGEIASAAGHASVESMKRYAAALHLLGQTYSNAVLELDRCPAVCDSRTCVDILAEKQHTRSVMFSVVLPIIIALAVVGIIGVAVASMLLKKGYIALKTAEL